MLLTKYTPYILQLGYSQFFILFSRLLCKGASETLRFRCLTQPLPAVVITRLSTLIYVMWSVALQTPSCTWSGLACSGIGVYISVSVCGFPLIIWSSLSIRRLRTLCCSGGFASIQPCSRNACLLLSPHYLGLVSFLRGMVLLLLVS